MNADNRTSALKQMLTKLISECPGYFLLPWKPRRTVFQVEGIKALKVRVVPLTILGFHLKYEALTKEKNIDQTSQIAVCLLDLRTVTVTEAPRHHGLAAAGLFGCVFLLSLGPEEHHHHDDEEHREEESDKEANDQHEALIAVVPLVELPGDDPFGEDLSLRTRLPLAAAVQRDVEDVGPAIVIHPDILHYVWHVIG